MASSGSGVNVATSGSGVNLATSGSGVDVATPGNGDDVATSGSGVDVATHDCLVVSEAAPAAITRKYMAPKRGKRTKQSQATPKTKRKKFKKPVVIQDSESEEEDVDLTDLSDDDHYRWPSKSAVTGFESDSENTVSSLSDDGIKKFILDDYVEKDPVYSVEKVKGVRETERGLEYLVKWEGYGSEDDSWVPINDIDAPAAVKAFSLANP